MKVLDLRGKAARDWQQRGEQGPRSADGSGHAWWVRATSACLDRIQARRVARRPQPPSRPGVVSVGNLALGGTGKTPVVIRLALDLAAAGHRGCVLTRGYGSRLAGPVLVGPDLAAAGDEARMMAAELDPAGWQVVQARNRRRGLAWVQRELPGMDVVILEDGHQTRVGRHLDVLIADSWSNTDAGLVPATGAVFPFGPWRESARGARRADLVLVEDAQPPEVTAGGQVVTGFQRHLGLGEEVPADRPWAALSGVARPGRFEQDATALLGRPARLAIRCDDHAAYDPALMARVTDALREAGNPVTVTTAKDWIKLRAVWPADLPVRVATQALAWTGTKTLPELVGERLADR